MLNLLKSGKYLQNYHNKPFCSGDEIIRFVWLLWSCICNNENDAILFKVNKSLIFSVLANFEKIIR